MLRSPSPLITVRSTYIRTQLRVAIYGVLHFALESVLSLIAPETQCVHFTQSRDLKPGLSLYPESGALSFVFSSQCADLETILGMDYR